MNAGGVPNTCKSSGVVLELALIQLSGGRVSNAWVTCPIHRDNIEKLMLIPDKLTIRHLIDRKAEAV